MIKITTTLEDIKGRVEKESICAEYGDIVVMTDSLFVITIIVEEVKEEANK